MQEHLAWLDSEIAALESKKTDEVAASLPPTQDPPSPEKLIPTVEEADTAVTDEPLPRVAGISGSQKAGCIALFLLMLALALFVIWVLPNLIF